MPVVRWDPFAEVAAVQERLNRIFNDRLRAQGEESLTGTMLPPVDIYETPEALVLKADLPGLSLEDLDVRVENNTLTIQGERQQEKEVRQEEFHRVERAYGAFSRSFSLPNSVDPEKIEATYEGGVLRLSLAKREETKPKQIKVQVGSAREVEAAKAVRAKQIA